MYILKSETFFSKKSNILVYTQPCEIMLISFLVNNTIGYYEYFSLDSLIGVSKPKMCWFVFVVLCFNGVAELSSVEYAAASVNSVLFSVLCPCFYWCVPLFLLNV